MSKSEALFNRARAVLPGGNSRSTIDLKPHPIYVTHGNGSTVFDVDGNAYVDFNNNYTSLIRGHADPVVIAAVSKQLTLGTAFAFATEQEVVHAELLCSRVPGFDKIRFMNSGSEAVMNALKAARAATSRPKIAKCEGAYHGSYDFAEVSLNSGPENWGQNEPKAIPYSRGTPEGVLDDVVVHSLPRHACSGTAPESERGQPCRRAVRPGCKSRGNDPAISRLSGDAGRFLRKPRACC